MNIAMIAVGTRGDLQPFVALGVELKQHGHDVLIISSKNEKDFALKYGLAFHALEVDIRELMESDEVQELAKGNNPVKFFISHRKNSKNLKKLMVNSQGEIWRACEKADVLIYHPGMPIGFFIAREKRKISILVNPFPVIPTKEYPSILFYRKLRLGKMYNLFTHAIFEKLFWSISRPALREFWSDQIKSVIDLRTPAIAQQIKSGMPVLNAYSRLLFSHDPGWSANIHTTGPWIIKEQQDGAPPRDLEEFLNQGAEPVYIGFGSMRDAKSFESNLDTIVDAITSIGQRAVVGLGWNSMSTQRRLPNNILLTGDVPFSWLFPRVSAVIHHGGAGTTAAGLAAGKPTLIIPHHADQPAWGLRVYELGVGAKPIPKANLSAEKLASAILFLLQPEVKRRAQDLGKSLREEGGVNQAVRVIEKYVMDHQASGA